MARSAYIDYCLELLAPCGPVRARAMFGGHGLYCDDLFFALIHEDCLHLKVDAQTEADFAAAGCKAFVYEGKGKAGQNKPMTLSYWTVPEDAMESPGEMRPWAQRALAAALRARAAVPRPAAPRTKKTPSPSP
jgi:DNA transformation protein